MRLTGKHFLFLRGGVGGGIIQAVGTDADVCAYEGPYVGVSVGADVGAYEGLYVGVSVGADVGAYDGLNVGVSVGDDVGAGYDEDTIRIL